ncbi:hypothetical protein AKN87_11390 [Thiopseudomonas alkaliphila]|uniref:flippase n=1 Tax=Thiopseudomonas alkaliphila TaxID=1697053 RepID=UPI00069E4D2F|nr:flippase [Thiopseudomonas alkaliphila]AKX45626.1 hypothetical protein AKN87_11390 [Thiopseudomonas alkaliphila]AKX48897.1 hypothetical protein AKN93_05375 [Thiopseudomonas alkaliphila]AKX55003.1 hypothetical protein AKN90_04230 [Thiopseudomonas alkaliphila]
MRSQLDALLARFKKSKDGKVLASNFGYLMLLQIAGYVFPLITIPYLARVIGVDGFGKIAFAAAVMVWFQTVSDWGFNYTATRDVARNRDNLEKVSEIFSNVFWARIFLAVVSFALLYLLIATVPYFNENKDILLVTFLLVPGHILFPDWFFQAMERMKFITFFSLLTKALFTVLVFVFVTEKEHYIIPPLLTSLGFLLSGAGAMYLILGKWGVKLKRPQFKAMLATIKGSTDVFINNIMPNLYNSFSVVLLGFMGGSVANGLLDAGSKFINIAQQFMNIISRVFFPFLSRKIDQHHLYARGSLALAAIGSLVLFMSAPLVIKLFFTEEFYESILVMQIMSASLIFLALSTVYGTNYLILKGKEKELRNITFICSVLGFAAAFPLIYFFGFLGTAINIVLTRAVLGLSIRHAAINFMRLQP